MNIDAITSSAPTTLGGRTGLVSSEDFFAVLTAQLTGQNPLEPIGQQEFLAQLAQFSQLEQSITTNQQLAAIGLLQENLAAIQQLTQGSSLIGQEIEYVSIEDGSTQRGEVQALRIEDGLVVAELSDGTRVPLPMIQAVLGTQD